MEKTRESPLTMLQPMGAVEQARATEALRRALSHAVTLVEGGAGVLALRDDGAGEGALATPADETRIITWAFSREAARRLISALAEDPTPQPMDGRPRVVTMTDLWAGEIATLTLGDLAGPVADLHLLGPAGFAGRRALTDLARRQALIGIITAAARLYQETMRLRQENRQLSAILHFSGDGIVTVDAALRITGFNPAMEAMTAWRQHEALGRFYHDVLLPRDLHDNPLGYEHDPVVQAIETGVATPDRELILLARDGQRIEASVTAAAVLSPGGQPISVVLNVRDITRSRESEDLRNTFVSVVSHELQTPIAIIKGYASTLAREDAHWDAETLRARLTAIAEESDRLNHLVANLLYASRIHAGGLTMERTELDLSEITRSVVRRFKARSPDRAISVRFPALFPLVLADRERIEEVLLNLLDNAVKYSPRGQRIRVRGELTDDEAIIHITDMGQGIPLREQERIFERFQRIDNTAARRTQGAGLGLYICRAIIEAHGGRIWVRSALGRGSVFSFSLPREERPQAPMVIFGGERSRRDQAERMERVERAERGWQGSEPLR